VNAVQGAKREQVSERVDRAGTECKVVVEAGPPG